jgi:hypothetical protein
MTPTPAPHRGPHVEPPELFTRHQEHVASFCKAHSLTVKPATLADAAALEELNTRHLLPKLGAKLYHVPFSFFILPALVTVVAARRFHLSPENWRICAIAGCVGTVAFAVFRLVTFPNLFRQAVERTRARGQK